MFPLLLDFTAGLMGSGTPNPLYYIVLFVAGFVLVSDERVQRVIDRGWRWFLVAAVGTMAVVLSVKVSNIGADWTDGSWQVTLLDLVSAVNMWLWVLGLMGAASAFLRGRANGRRFGILGRP